MISRSQLATVVSGVPAAADVFPSPTSTAQSRSGGRGGELQRSPPALRRSVDPATAKPQVGLSELCLAWHLRDLCEI